MIRIIFVAPTDGLKRAAFDTWLNTCATEQADLKNLMTAWLDEWTQKPVPSMEAERKKHFKDKSAAKPKIKSTVYAGQKNYYSEIDGLFRGKCAYCETEIYRGSFGDVDHFRPKGSIREYPAKTAVIININGGDEEHPGYYWLAYTPENLLYSCDLCNKPNRQRSGNRLIGKHDFFPLETNFRATQPGEEAGESPLLINPFLEDPDTHLLLDQTGVLASKTERGRMCIEMLGLNERDLPNARRRTYKDVRELMGKMYGYLASGDMERASEVKSRLLEIKNGAEAYTMAARKAIEDAKAEILQRESEV